MADTYVDLTGSGSATSPYDTWAKATSSMQTAITQAGAGGRVFVKTDASGTNKDTAASSRTLTSPGDEADPVFLIGVKSTTSAEPPTDSDLCVRGTDTLPMFEATGTGSDITFLENFIAARIDFDADDRITASTYGQVYADGCRFSFGGLLYTSGNTGTIVGRNCDVNFKNVNARIRGAFGGDIIFYGGLISGSSPTYICTTNSAAVLFFGTDLSNAGSTLISLTSFSGDGCFSASNCKVPASVTLSTGVPLTVECYAELISSSSETALGTDESVRDYEKDTGQGTIAHELTAIRTGGADDGVDGGFSFALTPGIDRTLECAHGVKTPWLPVWVDGDGSTAKTFTVYLANSGSSDYNTDDVRLEVLTPSEAGDTQHDFTQVRDIISGSTTALTDDTTSTWGTGASNAQTISTTKTPDFSGLAYARVYFMKRFAASPETLYVDPVLIVS